MRLLTALPVSSTSADRKCVRLKRIRSNSSKIVKTKIYIIGKCGESFQSYYPTLLQRNQILLRSPLEAKNTHTNTEYMEIDLIET